MSRHILAVAIVGTLFAVTACGEAFNPIVPSALAPAFARLPADGNGNKQVFPIVGTNQVTCPNGAILTRTLDGWVQVRLFDGVGNRRVELDVFHTTFTFTNSAGESFVWRDVGPDRYRLEDGILIVAITGRTGGHIGVVRVNVETGEVLFSAGQDVAIPRDQACAALT